MTATNILFDKAISPLYPPLPNNPDNPDEMLLTRLLPTSLIALPVALSPSFTALYPAFTFVFTALPNLELFQAETAFGPYVKANAPTPATNAPPKRTGAAAVPAALGQRCQVHR